MRVRATNRINMRHWCSAFVNCDSTAANNGWVKLHILDPLVFLVLCYILSFIKADGIQPTAFFFLLWSAERLTSFPGRKAQLTVYTETHFTSPALNVVAQIQCSGWLKQLWDGSSSCQFFFVSYSKRQMIFILRWSLDYKGSITVSCLTLDRSSLAEGRDLDDCFKHFEVFEHKDLESVPIAAAHVVSCCHQLCLTEQYIKLHKCFYIF